MNGREISNLLTGGHPTVDGRDYLRDPDEYEILSKRQTGEMCQGCTRRVEGATYCCPACAQADNDGYEIHETGPLAHSAACDGRWAARLAGK